ncbi:MAG: US12 family protein [Acidobacteria bacterium]|nr:US12 family protein [Acidobacteriota bacterium]
MSEATLPRVPVASLDVEARSTFVMQTYLHLFMAILAFVGVEIVLFTSGIAPVLAQAMLGVNWLLVLGAFMIVGWFATRTAHRAESLTAQYLALGAFVVAEAVIFVPLLYVANFYAPGAITSAALVTLLGFGGLTAVAFVTRKDFSFLGALLRWGFLIALVLIVAGVIFGFQLGTFFSVAMIALAGGSVLYDTSKILHHYPHDRYVGAALELFASVALMFWYILRLFMSRR